MFLSFSSSRFLKYVRKGLGSWSKTNDPIHQPVSLIPYLNLLFIIIITHELQVLKISSSMLVSSLFLLFFFSFFRSNARKMGPTNDSEPIIQRNEEKRNEKSESVKKKGRYLQFERGLRPDSQHISFLSWLFVNTLLRINTRIPREHLIFFCRYHSRHTHLHAFIPRCYV